jgi:hypothetical protein
MKASFALSTTGLLSIVSLSVALAGCAAPTDEADTTSDDLSGAKSCRFNSDCGGGNAVCFIDHCASVVNETRSPGSDRVATGFDPTGSLKIAYTTSVVPMLGEPVLAFGPWDGAAGNVTPLKSGWAWSMDSAPGAAPKIVFTTPTKLVFGDDPFHATTWVPLSSPNANAKMAEFAVAENAAGTRFAAMKLVTEVVPGPPAPVPPGAFRSYPRGTTTNEIWLSSRPAYGSWSAPEKIYTTTYTTGSAHSVTLVAVHPRRDGVADVLYTEDQALIRAHRHTATDPYASAAPGTWVRNDTIIPKFDWISARRGGDGSTHVAFGKTAGSPTVFDNSYLEIDDRGGYARKVSLGRSTGTPAGQLYRDFGVDGAGNVWMLKETRDAHPLSIVRVDRSGIAVERKLDDVGATPASSLAVAKDGTIALVWASRAATQPFLLRRFVPKP